MSAAFAFTLHAMDWLKVEDRDGVRWLVLDNPGRRNAVPAGGWTDLHQAFVDFEASEARVLVITGAGGDFCAGADLERGVAAGVANVPAWRERMAVVGGAATALHRLTKPVIAAVRGVAVGAGLNLALGCDVVVCGRSARFSEIFVKRGLTMDFGGSWLLPRIVGLQRARELALSGRIVVAEEAKAIGLVLDVVDDDELDALATAMADRFLEGAPFAQMLVKQGINRAWESSFEQAVGLEGQSQALCFATDDFSEGISSFLDKRPPEFTGR